VASLPSPSASLSERLAEILSAIEGQWRRLGAPIAEALRPGLDDGTMDSTAAAYGWTLPPESLGVV